MYITISYTHTNLSQEIYPIDPYLRIPGKTPGRVTLSPMLSGQISGLPYRDKGSGRACSLSHVFVLITVRKSRTGEPRTEALQMSATPLSSNTSANPHFYRYSQCLPVGELPLRSKTELHFDRCSSQQDVLGLSTQQLKLHIIQNLEAQIAVISSST